MDSDESRPSKPSHRHALLDHLRVPTGAVTRPESLLAVDINRDRITMRSSQGENWSGSGASASPLLQACTALATQTAATGQIDATAGRLLLDVPDLWAHVRVRAGAFRFDFASAGLCPSWKT